MPLYDAFLSYSHATDKPIAAALQSVVQKLGKPWYRRRALRVFRDDTSLSAAPGLWAAIEQALAQSRFFILLASPEAASSRWVDDEVAFWIKHKGANSLLLALTDGDLWWDQSFGDFRRPLGVPLPPALQGAFQQEPKWVDLRGYRERTNQSDDKFSQLAADLAATVRGTPKEDLLSEEVRQQRRALTMAWSAAASLLVLAGLAYWQRELAVNQEWAAQQQRDVADKQRAIAQANDAIVKAELSSQQTDMGNAVTGALLALESLQMPGSRPYQWNTNNAEVSLRKALYAQREISVETPEINSPEHLLSYSKNELETFPRDRDDENEYLIFMDSRRTIKFKISADLEKRIINVTMRSTQKSIAIPIDDWRASFFLPSPDGSRLLIGGLSAAISHYVLYDTDSGRILRDETATAIFSACFSSDSKMLALAFPSNRASIWRASDAVTLQTFTGHTAMLSSVSCSKEGAQILTTSEDGTARIWDTKSGAQVAILLGHTGWDRIMNGRFLGHDDLVTTIGDITKRTWRTADRRNSTVYRPTFSFDKPLFITIGNEIYVIEVRDKKLYVRNISTGKVYFTLSTLDTIKDVKLSTDGDLLAILSEQGGLQLWSLKGRSLKWQLSPIQESTEIVGFALDNARLVVFSDAGIFVIDVDSGQRIGSYRIPGQKLNGLFVGYHLIYRESRAEVCCDIVVADVDDGREIYRTKIRSDGGDYLDNVASDRDASRIILMSHSLGKTNDVSYQFAVQERSVSPNWKITTARGAAASLALDGLFFAILSHDRTVDLFDTVTGKPIHRFNLETPQDSSAGEHSDYERLVSFTQDGKYIVAGTEVGPANSWELLPNQASNLVEYARAMLPRCLTAEETGRFAVQDEPPRWCVTGASRENESDPAKWEGKWPYDTVEWKQWLQAKDAGRPLPSMPSTLPEWARSSEGTR